MSDAALNLQSLLAPALLDRLVLLVNHVLSQEPQAMARMVPHAGRCLRLEAAPLPALPMLPALPVALPQLPALWVQVTPAGLLERVDEARTPDLLARLDLSSPLTAALQMARGAAWPISIEGDAQLAADVDWLVKNVRWDLADDLQRLVGPVAAQQLQQAAAGLAQGLRRAVQGAAALASRWRGA